MKTHGFFAQGIFSLQRNQCCNENPNRNKVIWVSVAPHCYSVFDLRVVAGVDVCVLDFLEDGGRVRPGVILNESVDLVAALDLLQVRLHGQVNDLSGIVVELNVLEYLLKCVTAVAIPFCRVAPAALFDLIDQVLLEICLYFTHKRGWRLDIGQG